MSDRSVDEIRADVRASREKLASVTGDVFESVKPANMARAGAEQVKAFAKTEINTIFGHFRHSDGSLRLDRILMVGGAVVGALVLAASVRNIGVRREVTHQVRKEIEQ